MPKCTNCCPLSYSINGEIPRNPYDWRKLILRFSSCIYYPFIIHDSCAHCSKHKRKGMRWLQKCLLMAVSHVCRGAYCIGIAVNKPRRKGTLWRDLNSRPCHQNILKPLMGGGWNQLVFVQSVRGFLPYEKGQGGNWQRTNNFDV